LQASGGKPISIAILPIRISVEILMPICYNKMKLTYFLKEHKSHRGSDKTSGIKDIQNWRTALDMAPIRTLKQIPSYNLNQQAGEPT
jgi:hypothetical protein